MPFVAAQVPGVVFVGGVVPVLVRAEAGQARAVELVGVEGSRGRTVGQRRLVEVVVAVGAGPAAEIAAEFGPQEVQADRVNRHRVQGHEVAGRPLPAEQVVPARRTCPTSSPTLRTP